MRTMRRDVPVWPLMFCAALVAVVLLTVGPPWASAQTAPTYYDRNGGEIKVGMFVNVPCLITAITPSLNPALTSVTVRTLPNVGSTDYDEGLELIVYPSQILKR